MEAPPPPYPPTRTRFQNYYRHLFKKTSFFIINRITVRDPGFYFIINPITAHRDHHPIACCRQNPIFLLDNLLISN
ncbi:LOW QUALITY PROTEIN: hypothetical protein YC2023_055242 [Brassica napus]